ncbi:dsDNA nuclease domain-containing protein [Leuconostoc lactis]|uniref:dsDNA nuclease domain-containing protein n=1 Tax=Leuconostoc lactis TaxID=1246 RepID=UPI00289B17F1|nr:dsDNA nuclease domain-containing protein [Leuconostoc lactis]
MANTNASATQAGFHYQDVVSLILLLDNIKDVSEINVEGNDDVDILFTDGTYGYYQVKEVENPNSRNTSTKLKEALQTLEEDSNLKHLKLLTYVSNANQPLGILKNSVEFFKPYAYYQYKDLSDGLKKKIDDKLAPNSNIDTNKLGIMKIAYEGADAYTRESELDKRINYFIGQTQLSISHFLNLKNEWRQMIATTTEFPKKTITKETFYSHTVVTEMFQTPDFDNFFDECDVLPGNEVYIQNNYVHYLTRLMENFQQVNAIETSFIIFKQANSHLDRKSLKLNFINFYYPKLKKALGLVDVEDDDVAKFIIWMSIRTSSVTRHIKDVIKL